MEQVQAVQAGEIKNIFCPLVKVDVAKREVWGVVTAEVPDRENEICDYSTTTPYYKAMVDEMSKATDGANIFPLRAMHGLTAAGKGISIEFRDDKKEVYMGFKVVDDAEWKKVEEAVYTGFSQGGRYVKRWKDGDYVRYTAAPGEVSLVDVPCLPTAHFDYVKADGTVEKRAFKTAKTEETPLEKTVEQKKAEFAAKVEPVLKGLLEDTINEHAYGQLGKGMYTIGSFASILESLKYLWTSLEYEREYEGDESPATDEVKACFTNLLNAFLSYAEEEVKEYSAEAAAFNLEEGENLAMTVEAADLQKAAKIFATHHKKAAAHEEAVACQHEKIAKAHEARAAECEADEEGENETAKKSRKSRCAFHKTKAKCHSKLQMCHAAFAAHHKKCAEAHSMKDTEKALKVLEIEETESGDEMQKTETAPAAAAAAETVAASPSTQAPAAAQAAETDNDVNKSLEKMLNDKVQKAMEAAFERVLNSPEFSKQIDERLAGKMLEKLGGQPAPTEVKSIPVPRPGAVQKAATVTDTEAIPPEFQHLVNFE